MEDPDDQGSLQPRGVVHTIQTEEGADVELKPEKPASHHEVRPLFLS